MIGSGSGSGGGRPAFIPSRSVRVVVLLATTVILIAWIAQWAQTFAAWDTEGQRLGTDLSLYLRATERWIAGGGFYPERQLAGPYDIVGLGEILYPPPAILLFLPFLALPAFIWWLVPVSVIAAVLWHWRPSILAWPVLAFLLWWPRTNQDLLTGNPAIWIAAFAALGTVWAWPSVLVLLKPTLAPAALIGIRRRGWWIGLAAFGLLALLFLPMWFDYARVLLDARHPHGWLYSMSELPMVLVGLVAWASTTRNRGAPG